MRRSTYLGHALFLKVQAKQAEQSFQASVKLDPNFGEPHYALGQLYEHQKKYASGTRKPHAIGPLTAAGRAT